MIYANLMSIFYFFYIMLHKVQQRGSYSFVFGTNFAVHVCANNRNVPMPFGRLSKRQHSHPFFTAFHIFRALLFGVRSMFVLTNQDVVRAFFVAMFVVEKLVQVWIVLAMPLQKTINLFDMIIRG